MITVATPETWQDLQIEVGRILTECGMEVHVAHKVQTVRTQIEIDVFATEKIEGRPYIIICECKRWKSAVPQETVHGVRTVMSDIGGHKGYIICTGGFQSGAYSAALATNVELVTWVEFQQQFELLWQKRYLVPQITERLDHLVEFTEPIYVPGWFHDLPEVGREAYRAVDRKHVPLGLLAMSMSKYGRVMFDEVLPSLPLRENLAPKIDGLPGAVLDALGYRELLDAMVDAAEAAVAEYYSVRDQFLGGSPAYP